MYIHIYIYKYINICIKYQGVAPGFNGWEIGTHLKNLKIHNSDIFEYREIFSCARKNL